MILRMDIKKVKRYFNNDLDPKGLIFLEFSRMISEGNRYQFK